MPKRTSKDINQSAFAVVQQATSDAAAEVLSDDAMRKQVMREMGRRGGIKGGNARAANLSSKRRSQIAKLAAKARWKSKKN